MSVFCGIFLSINMPGKEVFHSYSLIWSLLGRPVESSLFLPPPSPIQPPIELSQAKMVFLTHTGKVVPQRIFWNQEMPRRTRVMETHKIIDIEGGRCTQECFFAEGVTTYFLSPTKTRLGSRKAVSCQTGSIFLTCCHNTFTRPPEASKLGTNLKSL